MSSSLLTTADDDAEARPERVVLRVAPVGYLPGQRIFGLSKLARVVNHFAARPQVQERLTGQIANRFDTRLAPKAARVVIEAEHTCMTPRGVPAAGASTVTSTLHDGPRSRQEFLALTGRLP